ncbi:hypothetical protein Y1Q_0018050 [Alligator mississippiensis]|uniref:Uncharacterized protein n=1 Tax=Alligator mississippiensis TaxID=8496 RepID=A0A151MY58_ALLMI|nr:hypothetical protein Y1Q_0018050 [Alligator mississippiensis]
MTEFGLLLPAFVRHGQPFFETQVGRTFPVPADDVILLVIPPPVRFSYPCTCYNFYSHVKTLFRKLVIQQFFTSLQYLPIMDQLLF